MLISDLSSKNFKDQFSQKFSSLAKKSPCVWSMNIKIQQGEEGALIKHTNSGKTYFFPFPIGEKPVKDFIADIKKVLINHYPRIIEEILERHELTQDELAKQLEKKSVDELSRYEMKVVGTRMFRIDKALLWKNLFLLVLEKSTFSDDEIGKIYRYKLNVSPVTFLRNYRSGKFKSIEEASIFFFNNSVLIDSLNSAK